MAGDPVLVILRGNSGSGKTSAAREIQRRYGRGCALVEQDHLRRVVLREHGSGRIPTVAPAFITSVVRAALGHGYHVVLEGILHTGQYGELLRELAAERSAPTSVFWLEVSFAETVRRHDGRSVAIPVTAEQMRAWYSPLDLLGVPGEQILPESADFEQTVTTIWHASGLAQATPLTPCPVLCPRCAEEKCGSRPPGTPRP
jgi:predicted kinase